MLVALRWVPDQWGRRLLLRSHRWPQVYAALVWGVTRPWLRAAAQSAPWRFLLLTWAECLRKRPFGRMWLGAHSALVQAARLLWLPLLPNPRPQPAATVSPCWGFLNSRIGTYSYKPYRYVPRRYQVFWLFTGMQALAQAPLPAFQVCRKFWVTGAALLHVNTFVLRRAGN